MNTVEPIREERQINAMKAVLKNRSLRDYTLFTLGINSGLRISDLLKLKVEDVVNEKRKPRDRISIIETKTEKLKDFPLCTTCIKALREYLDNVKLSYDDYLFPSRKGQNKPLSRQMAWEIIHNAAFSIGITDKIGTHTLRKTFGYHAYKKGMDLTKVQKLLNHSTPHITLDYIGITRDELDNVYLNLNL